MRNTNLITTLLYAVLAVIILGVGYKACQIRNDQAATKLKENAERDAALRSQGLIADTTASGSSFTPGSDAGKSMANKDGVEDETIEPNKNNTVTPKKENTGNQSVVVKNPETQTADKPAAKDPAPKVTAKGGTGGGTSVKGPGSGRYTVRAGTFTHMDGARKRLEEVIKLGYPNAEIGKVNGGKYAVVVVYRSNDKAKAVKVADQLEDKGIDAAVFDQNKK